MGSSVVRLYHDHMLVKEPGTKQETPWHQDQPYYNVDGRQNVSFEEAAGAVPGLDDLPGDRIDRILDLISWPSGLRDLDAGQTVLGIDRSQGSQERYYSAEELEFAVSLMNRVVAGMSGTRIGMHVCRGNWSRDETTLLRGGYHPLAPYLQRLDIQGFKSFPQRVRVDSDHVDRSLPRQLGDTGVDSLEDELLAIQGAGVGELLLAHRGQDELEAVGVGSRAQLAAWVVRHGLLGDPGDQFGGAPERLGEPGQRVGLGEHARLAALGE